MGSQDEEEEDEAWRWRGRDTRSTTHEPILSSREKRSWSHTSMLSTFLCRLLGLQQAHARVKDGKGKEHAHCVHARVSKRTIWSRR